MIVCSCNKITTEDIRRAANYVTAPSAKLVLNMLNWEPDCSICATNLVNEIYKVFGEIQNADEL
jgi:bacterioferritin-associated ferredoxin